MAVGDRKQKHRVPKEVFGRSPVCENFEAEVKQAARQVEDADKAVAAAEKHVEKADAAAGTARAKRAKANGNRIGKLWRLGDWLERWEKEFGDHKRRGPDTFYAKAVKACGNKDRYYWARDIRGPFGYATEEAACKAGETESLRMILENIKLLKREAKSGVTAMTYASSQANGKCPVSRELESIHKGAEESGANAAEADRRRKNDGYYTPPEAITTFLKVETFEGLTWEPAEGDKRIVRELQQFGSEVFGSDKKTGTVFQETNKQVDNVVTNPPWDEKEEFISHAKECSRRKVALLLPLSALAGVKTQPLHQDADFPLRTVYVFVRRLIFDCPDGLPSNGSSPMSAAWFVWERGYQGKPTVEWILIGEPESHPEQQTGQP